MARGGPNHPLRTKSDTPPLRSSQLATLDVQSKDLSQGTSYNMYRQGLSRYPLDVWHGWLNGYGYECTKFLHTHPLVHYIMPRLRINDLQVHMVAQ